MAFISVFNVTSVFMRTVQYMAYLDQVKLEMRLLLHSKSRLKYYLVVEYLISDSMDFTAFSSPSNFAASAFCLCLVISDTNLDNIIY